MISSFELYFWVRQNFSMFGLPPIKSLGWFVFDHREFENYMLLTKMSVTILAVLLNKLSDRWCWWVGHLLSKCHWRQGSRAGSFIIRWKSNTFHGSLGTEEHAAGDELNIELESDPEKDVRRILRTGSENYTLMVRWLTGAFFWNHMIHVTWITPMTRTGLNPFEVELDVLGDNIVELKWVSLTREDELKRRILFFLVGNIQLV